MGAAVEHKIVTYFGTTTASMRKQYLRGRERKK
jgi:hypothetical protein